MAPARPEAAGGQSRARRAGADRNPLASERGQMLPIYIIAIFALLSLGTLLFQVGRAATLKTDGQTAADASALAAAKTLSEQLYSFDGSVIGVDEAQVRAAAEDYASQNGAEVTDFAMNACGVRVTVKTEQQLSGDEADEVGAEGDSAEAKAAASMGALGGTFGAFGAPLDGSVPAIMKPAAELAQKDGLSVTSTTGGTHVPGSYHYQGLAIDVAGSPTAMAKFFHDALETFDGRLLELFYDPIGAVDNNSFSPQGIGGHSDHVHIALSPTKIAGASSVAGADSDSGAGSQFGTLVSEVAGPQLVEYEDVSECALGSVNNLLASGYGGFVPSASSAQIAEGICRIGNNIGVSDKIMLAAFETGIVESGMQNLPAGDRDSAGVFQQRPSQGWGSYAQVTDVAYAAATFFHRAIGADNSGLTPGQLAQAVQRSAYPLKYDAAEGDARALMKQVGCTAGGDDEQNS